MSEESFISQNNQNSNNESNVDLISLLKNLWESRKIIIRTMIIFSIIGMFIALLSKKEYTASSMMVPQTNGEKKIGGNLGGLAAMAGINLGSMGGESGIPPTLYPHIINSIPFQKELLNTKITVKGIEEKVSFSNYYLEIKKPGLLNSIKKYTIGLPGVIANSFRNGKEKSSKLNTKDSTLLSITNTEYGLITRLNNQVNLSVNEDDGYITLSVNMPEPIAAAEMTYKAQELLQKYIIDFKTKKSSNQLNFIKERFLEKEKEFKSAQVKLASFQDRNRFLNSSLAQTTLIRYQGDYDLAFSVYSELAKQLETQQIQVKENTPVFTIIKPVSIPVEKSKPNRVLILIIWTLLGLVVGFGIVILKEYAKGLKREWGF